MWLEIVMDAHWSFNVHRCRLGWTSAVMWHDIIKDAHWSFDVHPMSITWVYALVWVDIVEDAWVEVFVMLTSEMHGMSLLSY